MTVDGFFQIFFFFTLDELRRIARDTRIPEKKKRRCYVIFLTVSMPRHFLWLCSITSIDLASDYDHSTFINRMILSIIS